LLRVSMNGFMHAASSYPNALSLPAVSPLLSLAKT
jgi:hypothetical protein